MWKTVKAIFEVPELRKKVLFILGILVIYRVAANIPLPRSGCLCSETAF